MQQRIARGMRAVGGVLSLALVLAVGQSANAVGSLDWGVLDASVFDTSVVRGEDVVLPAGPIEYRQNPADGYSEGYRPVSQERLYGSRFREVYDLPPRFGVAGVFRWIAGRMEEAGFTPVFRCSGAECGDVAGWRLYLSELIDGSKHARHYLLARTETGLERESWVAVYVSELDGQSRLVVDHLVPASRTMRDRWRESDLSVGFTTGTAELPEGAALFNDAAAARRRIESAGSEDGTIVVFGHADRTGPLALNIWLSAKRAAAVRDTLLEEFEALDDGVVKAYPLGTGVPASGTKGGDRRAVIVVDN